MMHVRTRKEQERDMRSALEMLARAQHGCDLPGSGDLAPNGPVNPSYAIGWAIGALRRALELPDQSGERT